MKLALVGGQDIADYSIADRLWDLVMEVSGVEFDFEIVPLGTDGMVDIFWQAFLADREFLGFNVARPWKRRFASLVDDAQLVHTDTPFINTVYKSAGRTYAANTDILGVSESIEARCTIAGKVILILGMGGVGIPATYHLFEKGAREIYLFDIVPTKIPDDRPRVLQSFHEVYQYRYDIVVNATPCGKLFLGRIPQSYCSPVGARFFRGCVHPGTIIQEMNYLPLVTEFLENARHRGLEIISGVEVLVRQAVHSFYLYTGRKFDSSQTSFLIAEVSKVAMEKEDAILRQRTEWS